MTITDKELDALASLDGIHDIRGMYLRGAHEILNRLIPEFRRQRAEIDRLQAARDEYARSLGLEPVRPGESIEDWLGRSKTETDPNVRVQPDLKVV